MGIGLFGLGVVDDPWFGLLLRRVGAAEECDVHNHVQLALHGSGRCGLGVMGVQPGIWSVVERLGSGRKSGMVRIE